MVTTFAVAGTEREARERIDAMWRSADSMTLASPAVFIEPAKIAQYSGAIAKAFYKS